MSRDPFRVLGLTPVFKIDPQVLEEQHRRLLVRVHPDRFVGASAQKQQEALDASCALTQAYMCLKDPTARAQALLALLSFQGDLPPLDGDFLQESFSLQEQVLEAGPSQTPDLARLLDRRISQEEEALESAFLAKNAACFARCFGPYQVLLRLREALSSREGVHAFAAG